MNYDPSQVGVPYVRAHRIVINYPDNGVVPSVNIEQSMAVLLADGTIRTIDQLPTISTPLDLAQDGAVPIPMINPNNGQPLGVDTDLNTAMLNVLAVLRSKQVV